MIPAGIRRLVRERATACCEYCRLPEHVSEVPFHIEHIVAQQHLQNDDPSNLALACDRCNRNKGPNLASIDPATGDLVRWFDPRRDVWSEHFELLGTTIVGLSSIGRATVQLLKMNEPARQRLRQALLKEGQS